MNFDQDAEQNASPLAHHLKHVAMRLRRWGKGWLDRLAYTPTPIDRRSAREAGAIVATDAVAVFDRFNWVQTLDCPISYPLLICIVPCPNKKFPQLFFDLNHSLYFKNLIKISQNFGKARSPNLAASVETFIRAIE